MFTCCHPALTREAQVALTLRTLAGLTHRPRSPGRSWSPSTRWGNACSGRRARSATPGSRSGCRRRTCCRSACRPCSRCCTCCSTRGTRPRAGADLVRPDLSGEAIRLARLLADADARRARGAGPARADAAARRPAGRPRRRRRRPGAAGGPGPRAVGPRRRSPRAPRCSSRRCAAAGPGRTRCRPPSRPCHAERAGRGGDRLAADRRAVRASSPGCRRRRSSS